MNLALLLVVAGLLQTKDSQAVAKPTEPPSKVAPARPWIPSLGGGQDPALTQLYNPRTGVTCTLRILRIEPQVDKRMVAKAPGTSDDHMSRNELSPCVE